jgi:hypothetical protein
MDAAPRYLDDGVGIRRKGAVATWLWGWLLAAKGACRLAVAPAVDAVSAEEGLEPLVGPWLPVVSPAARAAAAVCWLFDGRRHSRTATCGSARHQPDARATGPHGPRTWHARLRR